MTPPGAPRPAGVIAAAGTAVLVAAIITIALLGMNYAATHLDRTAIRKHVAAAFKNGDLDEQTHKPTDTSAGVHQYNDCLILMMAVNEQAPKPHRALSPLVLKNSNNPCQRLKAIIENIEGTPEGTLAHYHRYLHGHTAVAALAVGAAPLGLVRILFSFTVFSATAGLIVCSSLRMMAAARAISNGGFGEDAASRFYRGLFIGFASLAMMLFFGFQFFGMSLSHFPADILLLAYMGVWLAFDLSRWNLIRLTAFHSAFGALTAYFEFLTGGVPLSICLIFFGFAATAHANRQYTDLWRAATAAAAFFIGVVAAFAVKLGATVVVFDTAILSDFFERLSYRTAGDGHVYPWDTFTALLGSAKYIGAGWPPLGMVLLLTPAMMFVLMSYRLLRSVRTNPPTPRLLLLILATLSIYGWWIVFAQHSAQHNFFMVRIGVGAIFSVGAMTVIMHRRAVRNATRILCDALLKLTKISAS